MDFTCLTRVCRAGGTHKQPSGGDKSDAARSAIHRGAVPRAGVGIDVVIAVGARSRSTHQVNGRHLHLIEVIQ